MDREATSKPVSSRRSASNEGDGSVASRVCGSIGVTTDQDGALPAFGGFSALTIRPNHNCRVLEGGKNDVPRYQRAIYLVVDQGRAQCHAAFDSTSSAVRRS